MAEVFQSKNQSVAVSALKLSQQIISSIRVEAYLDKLNDLTLQCHQSLEGAESEQQRFERLLHCFYQKLAFSGNEHDYFSSQNSLMDYVIGFRTGVPLSLGIVFLHMAEHFRLDVKGVNFPGYFILRFDVSEERALFIDPLTGDTMSWSQMDARYRGEKGDLAELTVEELEPANNSELLTQLLYELKSAFIREKNYEAALHCIDQIVDINPENPYERRDRGLILHQLDCLQSAMQDYQFFLNNCPQDPSAKLIKIQMQSMAKSLNPMH